MKKKLTALLLVLALAASMSTALLAGNSVTLRVEGIDGNLYLGHPDLGQGDTVLTVVEKALTGAGIPYEKTDSQYGAYISAISGQTTGAFGGYDGWSYYVDGQSPSVSMSAYELKGGEDVLVAYGDMGALLPILTASRDEAGLATLTVTADVTTYDENWNATVSRDPVPGVRLTVDGAEYITDDKGQAVLSAESSAKERVTVQLEKKAESGAPLVIRLAPYYLLDLTTGRQVWVGFTDVGLNDWYYPYVQELAWREAITGFENKTFKPNDPVTRAQVANMLYNLQGKPQPQGDAVFSDVAADSWYANAVRWAYEQGIVTGAGGKFSPDAAITRQDLAVMLVRYQTNVVKTELAQTAEAPAFADNDRIAPYAAEAVYKLQKAGIISGIDGSFQPTGTATRGQLCKMLAGLVVSD